MVATMYAADGVGLAANQVGVLAQPSSCSTVPRRRAGAAPRSRVQPDPPGARGQGPRLDDSRGGLSVPAGSLRALRAGRLRRGDRVRPPRTAGAPTPGPASLARCLQHESDHLIGTVFGDRLCDRVRKQALQRSGESRRGFPARLAGVRSDANRSGQGHSRIFRQERAESARVEHEEGSVAVERTAYMAASARRALRPARRQGDHRDADADTRRAARRRRSRSAPHRGRNALASDLRCILRERGSSPRRTRHRRTFRRCRTCGPLVQPRGEIAARASSPTR